MTDADFVYLDNAATTFPKPPEVLRFMCDFYASHGVNPGRTGFDLALEAEEVGEARHEAALHELVDELLAQALDVERPTARQVPQVVLELGGAIQVRAARHDFVLEADRLRAAHRAATRHRPPARHRIRRHPARPARGTFSARA